MTSLALSRVPVKPLYNTSIKIFTSPLFVLYLQKVLLIYLKKYVFFIIYTLKLPLCVSFKPDDIFFQNPRKAAALNKMVKVANQVWRRSWASVVLEVRIKFTFIKKNKKTYRIFCKST